MKMKRYLPVVMAGMAMAGMLAACGDKTEDVPSGEGNAQTGNGNNSNYTEVTVKVTSGQDLQTMEGFGASDCWLGENVGRYWEGQRDRITALLFSQLIPEKGDAIGIGLSMWRVNLGAGTAELGDASGINADNANNRAYSYLSGKNYDWNKCKGQRYLMERAKLMNCESFVLFSNSPLVQYTLNGQGRSDAGGSANIRDSYYDDFAVYMATVADHFVKEGYNITHISPVNEPQYNWEGNAQEGSGWTNYQVAKLTKELDKALTELNCPTKILLSEAAKWTYAYKGNDQRENTMTQFFSPSSSNYVGNLEHVDLVQGGHSYWAFDNFAAMRTDRYSVGEKAKSLGIRTWQTEWSMLDACPSELGGNYDNISEFDIAAYMSKVIHTDIVYGNCSSWSYWTAMSVERWSQKNRFELIKLVPASGNNYDNNFNVCGTSMANDNLWVLGNYSLFVRPGYVRIPTDTESDKAFFCTAYRSPDSKKVAVVYSNFDRKKGKTVTCDLSGFGTPVKVNSYTTTSTKHLRAANWTAGQPVDLDPYSITTVVYEFE